MKNKIMLIGGCSHTAGSEIDGNQDSVYNRQHSYGNVLAEMMGYQPVNIAESGSTNNTIARSIQAWIKNEYDPNTTELFVLVGWTDMYRMEIPSEREHRYDLANAYCNFYHESNSFYWRINIGYEGADPEEKELIPRYHRFMAENGRYLEVACVNTILQTQYLLKSLNIDYVMCNTMPLITENIHTKFYIECVDQTKYFNMLDNDRAFYWYYRNLGYENPKATYWHHDEIPHELHAKELLKFIGK